MPAAARCTRPQCAARDPEKALKQVTDAGTESIKKVLVQSSQHYHPDKNLESDFGIEWHILCKDISKHLNGKYNTLKSLS